MACTTDKGSVWGGEFLDSIERGSAWGGVLDNGTDAL